MRRCASGPEAVRGALVAAVRAAGSPHSDAQRRGALGDIEELEDIVRAALAVMRAAQAPGRWHAPDAHAIRAAIEDATITPVYQPIVWLPTREIVGLEALSRFEGGTPDGWFAAAELCGLGAELELATLRIASAGFAHVPEDLYISFNVSAGVMLSSELWDVLAPLPMDRVVLELTEHRRLGSYGPLRAVVSELRSMGARVAIDDAGAGHSSFRHILEIRPDIVKLDRELITDLGHDTVRRALLPSLGRFAHLTRTTLIAEGVETEDQAEALLVAGVAFGQGYLLGRPGPLRPFMKHADTGGWVLTDGAAPAHA